MELGIYESLITYSLKQKLKRLDPNKYYMADNKKMDTEEAVHFLGIHLGKAITNALKLIRAEQKGLLVTKQIEISNNILKYLTQQIESYQFEDDLIDAEGRILEGGVRSFKQ